MTCSWATVAVRSASAHGGTGRPIATLDGLLSVDYSRQMEINSVIESLSALAQPTRLEVFRHLVRMTPKGAAAGEIAAHVGTPHNTLSTHLGILSRAGLIVPERHGRNIVYRADLGAVRVLVLYLLRDCCDGRPELCAPLIDEIADCCIPDGACCG
jgi:ArsR family transcriptional regulator